MKGKACAITIIIAVQCYYCYLGHLLPLHGRIDLLLRKVALQYTIMWFKTESKIYCMIYVDSIIIIPCNI